MSNSTSSRSSGRIDDNKFYKMDHKHRGYLVIVDNYEFDNPMLKVWRANAKSENNQFETLIEDFKG